MHIFKKFISVALTMSMLISTSSSVFGNLTTVKADDNKLSFTVMCNRSRIVREENGAEEFYKQLNEKLDCNITWICPDYNNYDCVKQALLSDDKPDVVLLDKDYLNYYAYNGYLWNMQEAWENSKTKNSGKISDYGIQYIENCGLAYSSDYKKGLYGFSPQRGEGTVTYIKTADLKKAGYDPEVIKKANLTFDEYYSILKNIKKNSLADYVLSPPGFFNYSKPQDTPQTIYLPDFYQDAEWQFYRNSDGEYVDGFTEQSMIDALSRIRMAISEGIIDKDAGSQATPATRKIFFRSDGYDSKVLSYYTGGWGDSLRTNIDSKGLDTELIAIKPVNDSKYIDTLVPTWAIVDKKDGRQQKIFDKFIDTMLDGRDIQLLWTYGAKGTHWDTKAETFTVNDKTYSYKEGEFHKLPRQDFINSLNSHNYIFPERSFREFDKDILDGQLIDPIGKWQYGKEVKEELNMFFENSKFETKTPYTPAMDGNIDEINQEKAMVISKVVLGEWTIEQGMQEYQETVGEKVKTVLEGLKEYTINEGKESTIEDIINNNNLEYIVGKDSSGGKLLTGVESGLKAGALKTRFGDNVVFKNADGKELAVDAFIGTGTAIELMRDNKVIDTVKIVVKGDIDGSGTIDVLDMEAIQKSILGIGDKLSGAYKKAASLTGGTDISVLDMEAIQKDILGIQKIN